MGNANQWMTKCEKGTIKQGCTRLNMECIGMMNEILAMNGRNSAMLYFCINNLGVEDLRTMFLSTMKQKKMYVSLKGKLKQFALDKEWYSAIKKDIDGMHNRQNHIWLITRENFRLTEYYPFFEEIGFDSLLDFSTHACDVEGQLGHLLDEWQEWKQNNQPKIDAHLESIKAEKTALENFRKQKEEELLAEKEMLKKLRKQASDEVKEMRENARKHLVRERKIEASFRRYYDGKY